MIFTNPVSVRLYRASNRTWRWAKRTGRVETGETYWLSSALYNLALLVEWAYRKVK